VSRRSWLFDLAVAAVAVVLGQLEVWRGIGVTARQGPAWVEATLYAVTATLLVLRRARPLLCLGLIVAVSVLEYAAVGSPEGFNVMLPALLAAYAVGRRVERPRSWWGLVLVVVLWMAWAGLDPRNRDAAQPILSLVWLGPWVIAWMAGALVRTTALAAEQRRSMREQRATQAVAEERVRIARELHDVIGHSVSVMTVQASAVRRRLTPDQGVERQALESVEAVGREALAELRRMVGALRGPGERGDQEPAPGLEQLHRLVEQFRAAGLAVELVVTGEVRALAPGLDLTAYRLIQEGLTNVLRHAVRPTHAEVSVSYDGGELGLSVRDDGQRQDRPGEAGHGLLGMKERVSVYGGELVARPLARGFELTARLPLDAETGVSWART
jgi:signal transduction histidine kinase